ncbi:MAG: OadG family protein [Bacteroidales bacterium]|nr:OadG family protein [Bacteroidales bacterium]
MCQSAILTYGAESLAQMDPHGWILTLISITIVFLSLLVLYFVYAIAGGIASGQFKEQIGQRKLRRSVRKHPEPDEQTAAAIALALQLYAQEGIAEKESGYLTTGDRSGTWSDKSLTLRKYPTR